MSSIDNLSVFELIYVIVNHGIGSKVLRKAKEHGISGGTILLGRGTIYNCFLNFFSLYDERKEIVLLGADKATAEHTLVELNKEFLFEKPNHGIAFTISTCNIVGATCCNREKNEERWGVNKPMFQFIITIVNRGNAEDVIDAAKAAGSKGGTIINARGSWANENSKVFNMEIEPEKEMVMILSSENDTETIVASIREKLQIDKPGNGIILIQNVTNAYGLYE